MNEGCSALERYLRNLAQQATTRESLELLGEFQTMQIVIHAAREAANLRPKESSELNDTDIALAALDEELEGQRT